MSARDDRRDLLIDFLTATPSGGSLADIMMALGISNASLIRTAIHDARIHLGDNEDMNLVWDMGYDGFANWTHIYRLVGSLDEARPWVRNRLDDAETRFTTIEAVTASIVRGTSGRTRDGRRARVIERSLRRMREDIADIDLNGVTP